MSLDRNTCIDSSDDSKVIMNNPLVIFAPVILKPECRGGGVEKGSFVATFPLIHAIPPQGKTFTTRPPVRNAG